jgi:hypothetical protein
MIVRTSRRTFVRGAASAGLTLPFLRLLERPAHAAVAKRLIVVATQNGGVMDALWANNEFGPVLEPLRTLKSKMNFLRLVNRHGMMDPHPDHQPDYPSMMTGFHPSSVATKQETVTAPSMENYIGRKIAQPLGLRFNSVYLGADPGQPYNFSLFAAGPSNPVVITKSPATAASQLFANIGSAQGGAPDPAAQRILDEKKNILDLVRTELQEVRCQLGAAEKAKFDDHITAVADVQRSLVTSTGGGLIQAACSGRAAPANTWQVGPNYGAACKSIMDTAFAAIACDVTRVVGIDLRSYKVPVSQFVPGVASMTHHDMAHSDLGDGPQMVAVDKFYAEQFAYLVKKLDSIQDLSGGTMLDNSVVVWVREQGKASSHARADHPILMAGSCAGAFKTGLMINQGSKETGFSHVRFLMSLAKGMGVPFNPAQPYDDPTIHGGSYTPDAEKSFWMGGPLMEILKG